MFGLDLSAKIRSATATRKQGTDGDTRDATNVSLAMGFTPEVAGGLGERGVMLQTALADGGLKSATLDLKSAPVVVELGLGGNADDQLRLNTETRVISLAMKGPAKEGAVPVATLQLMFPTEYNHLLWFVDRLEEVVPLKVQLKQTEMEV